MYSTEWQRDITGRSLGWSVYSTASLPGFAFSHLNLNWLLIRIIYRAFKTIHGGRSQRHWLNWSGVEPGQDYIFLRLPRWWRHQLNGHEFEYTSGFGNGQGGLACCSSWGRKELVTTEWLNWIELNNENNKSIFWKVFYSYKRDLNHYHMIQKSPS